MDILIADDDGASRQLLAATLTRWGYRVVSTSDGIAARDALLSGQAPRLAILDWMMPGMDGASVCRQVRDQRTTPYRYLILLTGQTGQDDLVAGLEAGADDYIAKPFRPPELRARLRAGHRILALQDELIAERDLYQSIAARDPLTKLWNHAEIFRILGHELQRARRDHGSVAAVIADLDRFGEVNNTFGHLAGDMVVRATAETMTALLRPYDGIGRCGGDEFLVILPGCDVGQASALAERLRAGISANPVDTPDGLVSITTSIGVAVCQDGAAITPDGLVRAADAALYRAKRLGANRVEVASSPEWTREAEAEAAPA
ncbi:MAG: diguanylate cyclase [Vicinamibacterales bacterium]